MQAASIAELKKALGKLEPEDLLDACLRLARFKKDNKELLTYLLFLSQDESKYAKYLCSEIDQQFVDKPFPQKKTIQKMVRWMNKCLRYSGHKETEVEVRIYFCRALNEHGVPFRESRVLSNLYSGQLKKIHAAIEKLHEDLRFDFRQQLSGL